MKTKICGWRFPTTRVVLAGALASLQVLAIDPDLPYSSPSTGADGALRFNSIPVAGRYHTAIAYDAAREQTVLFGGYSPSQLGDTWVLDSDSDHWVDVTGVNGPPGRYGQALAYDSVRQVVVLFGGYNGSRLNDTWVWNGVSWTQMSPATSPPGRYYHAMAFDQARGELVMYGGNSDGSGGNQTWTWNGTNWTLKEPAAMPGNISNHSMAYDPIRQRVILFTTNGQTWAWDGTNWANVSPTTHPGSRSHAAMSWDGNLERILLHGGTGANPETWLWNGSTWTQATPATPVSGRYGHAAAYDSVREMVVMYGGNVSGGDTYSSDTFFFDAGQWTQVSGKSQTFDMSGRQNGIFHFTTIDVPPGVTVTFIPNSANTPVRWFATGDVNINGTLSLNGQFGANALPTGVVAKGGPGGFDGGRGGIRHDQSGSFAGTPGQGPGGGRAGILMGEQAPDGDHAGAGGYGNVYLQPLIGGSGGGGGGSNATGNGGNGGGGGGAILIDTSRDIILTGAITANGGDHQWSGASYGGRGAGGAIHLRGDRISGGGLLEAVGAQRNNPNGRIRLEAFFRTYSGSTFPGMITSDPVQGPALTELPTLTETRVAAQTVPQPPSGNQLTPDVVFNSASQVEIEVTAQNVPNGTPVRLRLTTREGVITAGPSFLQGGTANFNLVIPPGVGSIQAFADFRTGN